MLRATMSRLADAQLNFAEAGAIAEEILYSIKTVVSFANFKYEKDRFNKLVNECFKKGMGSALRNGFGMGFMFLVIFGSYSLAVWYGGTLLVARSEYNPVSLEPLGPGNIITVLFATVFGAFSLGMAAPNLRGITDACQSAFEFFETEERQPQMDTSLAIEKPAKESISGSIFFNNVKFNYPSRADDVIFEDLSLHFEAGKKTAIVGESGSGKTTIIHLIERLYDIQGGAITLDNVDIRTIDLNYLRSVVGYVAQEPVLFNTTIRDNIVFGRDNQFSEEEILEACRKAFILEFVKKVGLDYIVGIKGSKLSGGQKQRIAIARAILSNPKILILDEATSALDNTSEKEVQIALDKVSENVTTIIVAHRLSTIINSDKILVLANKQLAEEGTHKDLLERGGEYFNLFKNSCNTVDALNLADGTGEHERRRSMSVSIKGDKVPEEVVAEVRLQTETRLVNEELQAIENKIVLAEPTPEELKQKEEEEEKLKDEKFSGARMRLFYILGQHKGTTVAAIFGALLNGAVFPAYGVLLGMAIDALSYNDSLVIAEKTFLVAMYFLILMGGAALANFMQNYFFNAVGEILTNELRQEVFSKYLNLDMSYFDKVENSPGSMLTRLANDTTKINGVALAVIGVFFQAFSTLTFGLITGFYFDWRLTLINIGCLPFMVIAGFFQNKFRSGQMGQTSSNDKEAGSILSESVVFTKTIFCNNMQHKVVEMYDTYLEKNIEADFKGSICEGISYGFSQLAMFSVYALIFFSAGQFIKAGLALENMFVAIFVLLFSGFGLGQAQQYIGDYTAAKEALISLYDVIDFPCTIDPKGSEETGEFVNSLQGKIEFRNVSFSYPSSPDKLVLDNINFTIMPGQQIAFVGASGCGKSTIVQLIERYYDVNEGEILLDDKNIKELNITSLRKQIGIVMQEPALFKRSIYDNILYGNLEATSEQIMEAARKAYIDELVKKDVDNDKEISGGQKQRVAIARAIVKNPSILMLDEATSALDKESETIVQKALDNNLEGRTSISIAHRLVTIMNSTKIFVLDNGKIIEEGTHEELLTLKKKYYILWISGSQKNETNKEEIVKLFADIHNVPVV